MKERKIGYYWLVVDRGRELSIGYWDGHEWSYVGPDGYGYCVPNRPYMIGPELHVQKPFYNDWSFWLSIVAFVVSIIINLYFIHR